jgi:hypothetical protein
MEAARRSPMSVCGDINSSIELPGLRGVDDGGFEQVIGFFWQTMACWRDGVKPNDADVFAMGR